MNVNVYYVINFSKADLKALIFIDFIQKRTRIFQIIVHCLTYREMGGII